MPNKLEEHKVSHIQLGLYDSDGLFTPPKLTTSERDNISSPGEGVVIFNTTTKKLEVYDGNGWQECY